MITGGLVVTHGDLGQMLVDETQRLIGGVDRFIAMKTEGLSAGEISTLIRETIDKEPWIVFTDAPGTSPTTRARAVIVPGQAVVTGVNLGILMSFLVHRGTIPTEELAERLINDGIRSLKCWMGQA